MSLGGEVEEDGVVGVVEMGKDTEELSVDVSGDGGEVGREFTAWYDVSTRRGMERGVHETRLLLWGRRTRL